LLLTMPYTCSPLPTPPPPNSPLPPYTTLFRSDADEYRSLAVVRQHRILRRGRPYGTALKGWPDPRAMLRDQDKSVGRGIARGSGDRKSTRLNSSHEWSWYAVVCL